MYTTQVKGSAADPVEVSIPDTITSWGSSLLSTLAGAVGVPGVAEIWIRCSDDGTEYRLEGGRMSWRVISRLDPGDVVLVVGSAIPLSRTLHEAGSRDGRTELPSGRQWYLRLEHVVIGVVRVADGRPDGVPRIMQKVSCTLHKKVAGATSLCLGPHPLAPPPPWLCLGDNAALYPIRRPSSPIGALAGHRAAGQVDIGLW